MQARGRADGALLSPPEGCKKWCLPCTWHARSKSNGDLLCVSNGSLDSLSTKANFLRRCCWLSSTPTDCKQWCIPCTGCCMLLLRGLQTRGRADGAPPSSDEGCKQCCLFCTWHEACLDEERKGSCRRSFPAEPLLVRPAQRLSTGSFLCMQGVVPTELFCSGQGRTQWPAFCAPAILCRQRQIFSECAAGNYKSCRKVWFPWRPPCRPTLCTARCKSKVPLCLLVVVTRSKRELVSLACGAPLPTTGRADGAFSSAPTNYKQWCIPCTATTTATGASSVPTALFFDP